MPPSVQAPIDDATFTTFLQTSMPGVRLFVLRLCGRDADADDVLQETLAKAWRLRASFDARQNGLAWLQQAAFRCFCDHRRRLRKLPTSADDGITAAAPLGPCATELRDELEHRLAALPPLERALLLGLPIVIAIELPPAHRRAVRSASAVCSTASSQRRRERSYSMRIGASGSMG